MENSRVNLGALMLALIAGIVALHVGGSSAFTGLAGLTLLIALFAYGNESARTGLQSFAFALVCGLGFVCVVSFPLNFLIPLVIDKPAFLSGPYFAPVFWLIGTAMFWFIDRASSETPQAVHLGGAYAPAPIMAQPPPPQPVTRPFTPAPVTVAVPPSSVSDSVSILVPEPVYASSAPAPAPVPLPLAATPPLTGKEVGIYVTMLGEGMNVLRTVRAEHLGRDFYVITEEMPADESWQFVTGQVVRCKKKNLSNGKGLVAFEEAPRAQ